MKETLKHIQSVLRDQPVTKGLARKLDKTIRFYDEIEVDLELGGESIIELDQRRIEAIQERNKAQTFMNQADDL